MALADKMKQTLYPFAEMFSVTTSTTSSVNVWDIPKGTIITNVIAKVSTAGAGSGNIIVGDDDDDNGYILAFDGTSAADTVFGDIPAERGAYLDPSVPIGGTEASAWKVYTADGKELKIDCSGSLTTEAILDIMVFGYRYYED